MIAHVHCNICHISIPTEEVDLEKKEVDFLPINMVQQSIVIPTHDGKIRVVERPVPICERCFKNATARSRILVP